MSARQTLGRSLGLTTTPERVAELDRMGHARRFWAMFDLVLAWQVAVGALLAVVLTQGVAALGTAALSSTLFLLLCYGARALVRRRKATS